VQPQGATGEEEKHVVFTVQPRIAAASLAFVEIPAGMLDGGSLAGKAATELKEEADLTVEESELTNMSKLALNLVRVPFPSPTSLQIVELPA
jgi:ADP-sugar diphosphatase